MMKNSELLADTHPKGLLRQLEKQRRYVLRIEASPRPCPNCATLLKRWEALGITDVDDYDLNKSHPDLGECPSCHRQIRFTLPLFAGSWHWSLVPIEQGDRP